MFSERLTHILARGFFVWLLIIFVETNHGIARTLLLEPFIGDFRARQVSVFTGTLLILAITLVFVRWLKSSRAVHFFLVGLMWVVLTIAFEISLGRFALHLSWERILADYNLATGGLMLVGLFVMLIAPLASAKLFDEI